MGSGVPGPINGDGDIIPLLWGWGSVFLGSSISPAGTSLGGVSDVSAWACGEHPATLRKYLILDKYPSPVSFSLETVKVSHCFLAHTHAQQASLHQPQAKVSVWF